MKIIWFKWCESKKTDRNVERDNTNKYWEQEGHRETEKERNINGSEKDGNKEKKERKETEDN